VKSFTANGASVTLNGNTTINAANSNVYGKQLFVKANTTFQNANTNIRGNRLFVGANAVFSGSLRINGTLSGVIVREMDDVDKNLPIANGSVLVYHTANSTWAPGIIDGGTY